METISDPKEVKYALAVIMDMARAKTGDKALVIVSAGKSRLGFDICLKFAREAGLVYRIVQLICEDGELYAHLFAGRDTLLVIQAIEVIFDRVSEDITRQQLQVRLGYMLGHNASEVLMFTRSLEGLTCECDCCGGPPPKLLTHQAPSRLDSDAEKARSQYYWDAATDA